MYTSPKTLSGSKLNKFWFSNIIQVFNASKDTLCQVDKTEHEYKT